MNKHVAKLLQPGVFWYCLIMLAFAAAAALFDQYYLAVGELVVTVIVMVVSRLLSVRRRNALRTIYPEPVLDFVQSGARYYILTHPEEEYPTYLYAAMYYPCATQIVSVDQSGNETLLASRDERNNMQNLTDLYVENGKIYVAGTYCMGMMDVHCALYEVADGNLTALFGES